MGYLAVVPLKIDDEKSYEVGEAVDASIPLLPSRLRRRSVLSVPDDRMEEFAEMLRSYVNMGHILRQLPREHRPRVAARTIGASPFAYADVQPQGKKVTKRKAKKKKASKKDTKPTEDELDVVIAPEFSPDQPSGEMEAPALSTDPEELSDPMKVPLLEDGE